MFDKKLFQTSAISLSLERNFSFLTIIFSFVILALEIIGLRVFQNFLISVIFFSLKLLQFRFAFLNNDTEKYLYLVYFFRFSSFLFSRKLFFNSVLFFISLLNVLFMNCDWFLLTYVFFRGECLSNTSTYILKKLWKCLSFVLN